MVAPTDRRVNSPSKDIKRLRAPRYLSPKEKDPAPTNPLDEDPAAPTNLFDENGTPAAEAAAFGRVEEEEAENEAAVRAALAWEEERQAAMRASLVCKEEE
jgi:hypothetical protein